jgi:hypothetical protein
MTRKDKYKSHIILCDIKKYRVKKEKSKDISIVLVSADLPGTLITDLILYIIPLPKYQKSVIFTCS